ncbi:MAG TPA: hypothetical protein VF106_41110 [Actinophytocola sp.]
MFAEAAWVGGAAGQGEVQYRAKAVEVRQFVEGAVAEGFRRQVLDGVQGIPGERLPKRHTEVAHDGLAVVAEQDVAWRHTAVHDADTVCRGQCRRHGTAEDHHVAGRQLAHAFDQYRQ